MDDSLGPFERNGLCVVDLHKPVDSVAQLAGRGETGATQSRAAEDAEPAFHLIQPRTVGRRVVQMDVWVKPSAWRSCSRFVRVQIVEDHVDLAARMGGHQIVHEVEKLAAAATRIVPCLYLPGEHIQSGKQGSGPVALVTVAEAVHGLSIGRRRNPWARSSAWMWGFSSTESSRAFSGGFIYRPTTSAAFGPNSGSVLMHQLCRRCNWI